MPPTTLTAHAQQRLTQRTRLSGQQLIALIDADMTHIVGCRQEPPHAHHLFFSPKDLNHFVAVQDILTGEVITVLPLDYHENLAWKISEKHLKKAIQKSAPDFYSEVYPRSKPPKPSGVKPPKVATPTEGYTMEVIGLFSSQPQKVGLGKYRFPQLPTTGTEVMEDSGFATKVLSQITRKSRQASDLEEILLYHAKTDLLLKVAWFLDADFSLDDDISNPDYTTDQKSPSQTNDQVA
jgi:hypothetical protein